jgi:DNA helicase-2/ATP-dependent DNA helicase PcrA
MTNLPGGPIPFKKFGGLKFMERAFVMDILAFLKVLVNERDELPWFRIFQMYLNIGPAYAKKLVAEINRDGVEALNNPEHQKRKYGECLPMIYEFYNACKAKDFSQQMDDIINIHYYNARKLTIDNKKTQESVRREDRKELDKNIEEAQVLIEMARPYKTASDFLNDIALDANANNAEDDDYLTISTIHSAKGLEFDTVYIMNCVDGKFPMIKQPAADTIEAIEEAEEEFEEERRVFYVAATRAKENLKMYVPEIVYKFGRTEQATMNSFLKNNKEYCELIRVR